MHHRFLIYLHFHFLHRQSDRNEEVRRIGWDLKIGRHLCVVVLSLPLPFLACQTFFAYL